MHTFLKRMTVLAATREPSDPDQPKKADSTPNKPAYTSRSRADPKADISAPNAWQRPKGHSDSRATFFFRVKFAHTREPA